MNDGLPAGLVERLIGIRSLGVITGAGLSAESGIPTYRGTGGIYDDPEEGDRTVEALSGPTLRRDPDRTWRAIAVLAGHARGAAPNDGHRAIARLETRVERFTLLTQNVDGLHRRAGSRDPIDIHGDICRILCTGCSARQVWEVDRLADCDQAPQCERCGAVLRPDVVLFEELLPEAKLARLHTRLLGDPPDALIVAGTTAMFPYIAAPVHEAARRGRLTIEVNPERTELSAVVDFHLPGPAGEWLPRLDRALAVRGPGHSTT